MLNHTTVTLIKKVKVALRHIKSKYGYGFHIYTGKLLKLTVERAEYVSPFPTIIDTGKTNQVIINKKWFMLYE